MFFSTVVALALTSFAAAAPAELSKRGAFDGQNGDGTYYDPGLGACGWTNGGGEMIVAVGKDFFDSYPGYGGGNPNNNPICGRRIRASWNGHTIEATIVDKCWACAYGDLDFSPAAWNAVAPGADGRAHGVQWQII